MNLRDGTRFRFRVPRAHERESGPGGSATVPRVSRLLALDIDAEYLGDAFDEAVLSRLHTGGVTAAPDAGRRHAVSFVGSIHSDRVHRGGVQLLERLSTDVDDYFVIAASVELFLLKVERLLTRRILRDQMGLSTYRNEALFLNILAVMAKVLASPMHDWKMKVPLA